MSAVGQQMWISVISLFYLVTVKAGDKL